MRVVGNFNDDATWGVVTYIHETLEKVGDDSLDSVLMNGAAWIYHDDIKIPYQNCERRCLLALWSPCEFTAQKDYFHFEHYEFFSEVYCVCPFTCRFMNEHFGYEKFKYIPYPFTNYSVKEFGNYDADCSWMGSIHGQDHISAIETISKFDYKFLTSQLNTWMRHPYEFDKCTHVNLPSEEKLTELSKCRSSLSFNIIYMSPASLCNGENFDVFDHFSEGIMPQFKVRTHEIASSKSLLLVKRDPWNLIEDFYTPEEEFIYFDSFQELEGIIEDVRDNFNKYRDIIERAYNKSRNYTVEKIFDYIESKDDSLITWRNNNV